MQSIPCQRCCAHFTACIPSRAASRSSAVLFMYEAYHAAVTEAHLMQPGERASTLELSVATQQRLGISYTMLTRLRRTCSGGCPLNFACLGIVSKTRLHSDATVRRAISFAGSQYSASRWLHIPSKAHEHGVQLIVIPRLPVLIRLHQANIPQNVPQKLSPHVHPFTEYQ